MQRIVRGILSLAQHLTTIANDPEQYRPDACPRCGRAGLWVHGCYYRKADRSGGADGLNPVAVLRYLCSACVRTCSRLPECMAPRRWWDWAVQQAVLLMLLAGVSVHGCARASGRDRHTVRRWRQWLSARNDEFAFALRSRWPELGRASDSASFWRHVIAELSLAQAMAWIDRERVVP